MRVILRVQAPIGKPYRWRATAGRVTLTGPTAEEAAARAIRTRDSLGNWHCGARH